jgi:hypothetical protein
MVVKYQFSRELVSTKFEGKSYTGFYRVDYKRKMILVEWEGKSEQAQLLKTADVEVLAQTILSQTVSGKQ